MNTRGVSSPSVVRFVWPVSFVFSCSLLFITGLQIPLQSHVSAAASLSYTTVRQARLMHGAESDKRVRPVPFKAEVYVARFRQFFTRVLPP